MSRRTVLFRQKVDNLTGAMWNREQRQNPSSRVPRPTGRSVLSEVMRLIPRNATERKRTIFQNSIN